VPQIAAAALAAAMLTACSALVRASSTPPQPPAPEAWVRASAIAAAQVGAGSYAAADRMLVDFATQYPRTPEALSATVRRALYKADPANPTASAREATVLLDSALALPLDSASRADARMVRRITTALERAAALAATAAGSNATSPDSSARADDTRSSSDEVQRLRSELAKANAELERIKKRVAQPKP
jgi:TolA-binding protein